MIAHAFRSSLSSVHFTSKKSMAAVDFSLSNIPKKNLTDWMSH